MIRILVIDDRPVCRIGVTKVLTESFAVAEWGESANCEEALRFAGKQPWDLAILDLSIEQNRGLDLLKDLRQQFPKIPVLVLTALPEEQYGKRAMKAGASGFLSKIAEVAELTTAVRQVLRGGRYLSPSVEEALSADSFRKSVASLHEILSDREYQVMRLLGSGKTVGEIAAFLSISDKTVSTYRARILDKTSLRNNAEIVRYVVEHGLLD